MARDGALDRPIDLTPYRLDGLAGDGIDRLVVAHHRRRLTRHGHALAHDPPADGWAQTAGPPRSGNDVRVLVDGGEALPTLADELRRARSHVHIAGWHVDPAFRLEPDGPALAELLASLDVDVRVLVWAGAPLPLFRPSRSDVRDAARKLRRGRVRVELDARERPLHCEHSLFNDTELNLVVREPELARAARLRLWREHLERGDVDGDPAELVDTVWRPLADEQLARRESGEPLEHRLVRLPQVSKRSRRLLGPLQGLLVDG